MSNILNSGALVNATLFIFPYAIALIIIVGSSPVLALRNSYTLRSTRVLLVAIISVATITVSTIAIHHEVQSVLAELAQMPR